MAASAAEVTADGYAEPFASTNANYINWTFHNTTGIVTTDLESYKTISHSVESFADNVTIEIPNGVSEKVDRGWEVTQHDFDLPHTEHEHHGTTKGDPGYVVSSVANTYLKINNILPEDCNYKSYDLIFVYNDDNTSDKETVLTAKDVSDGSPGEEIKNYTQKEGNSKKTDPDEIIFRNLSAKSIELTWDYEVFIYSVSIDYHESVDAPTDVTLTTNENDFVSGIYYENDKKEGDPKGVIRFFQKYSGEADGYGFVFIDADNNILNGRIVKSYTDQNLNGDGFYGEVYDIAKGDFSNGITAKPYVSKDGYIIFSETSIKGTVNESNWVNIEDAWKAPAE